MNDLNEKILRWADDRGILANGTPEGQMRKVLEEYREAAEAIALYQFIAEASPVLAEHALERVKAELGDQYITLVIHAKMTSTQLTFPHTLDVMCGHENKWILDMLGANVLILSRCQQPDYYCTVVYLISQLAQNHRLTLRECVEHSYNVISKRTGEMIDGVFVKSK
jgi:hypothetical protein